ncbi:hypothetical protein [Streptomyces sp. NPDC017890]|uniref:hypothetical protein n=1 Tax=Streptomyces sp. NPDC017890 TaxID=3365015 RepID=UPI0037A74AFC
MVTIGQRMAVGGEPSEDSRDVLLLMDGTEVLLSEKALNYAVRGADWRPEGTARCDVRHLRRDARY